jgi:molecular chaperone DnaK
VRLGDPPLSRTIGVALANDEVQVFFERGSPLPIRRTFSLRTVEAVSAGNPGFALQVPIVQGELPFAHLCRLVGALAIPAEAVQASVPAGSLCEITLELDAGGRLTTSARIPAIDQSFSEVAQLIVPELTPQAIRSALDELGKRANALRASAFRNADPKAVSALSDVDASCSRIERALELAQGGDPDAIERARRLLVDVDALLCDVEMRNAWPKLEEEARYQLALASSWVLRHGIDAERELFANAARAVEKAITARNGAEVRRQLLAATRLGNAAYFRDPSAWQWQLEGAGNRVADMTDQRKGQALLAEGRRAAERGDKPALEQAVRGLWQLLPADAEERRLGYDSGVR